MSDSVEHILILRGLEAALDKIRERLGPEWPAFSRKFLEVNARIGAATGAEQARLIDELLKVGLASLAAEIFREVLRGAQSKSSADLPLEPTRWYQLSLKDIAIATPSRTGPEPVRYSGQHLADAMARRFLNVCLTDPVRRMPLPAATTLVPDAKYLLRFDIGALSSDSVVEDAGAQPFPAEQLPQSDDGHWLEVAVVSHDFGTPRRRFSIFLPSRGPSWVCKCPAGGGHACTPEGRQPHLFIPLQAPKVACQAELRVAVYFGKNLVQSQVVTAAVAAEPLKDGRYSARIDYSLTARLSDVSFLPPRDLSVLTNERSDGTHVLIFNGALNEVVDVSLTEGQMTNAIAAMRAALQRIHLDEWGGTFGAAVQRKSRYDNNNAKPRTEFIADLRVLADMGWRLWASLWRDRLDFWREHRDQFVRQSSVIQVARKARSPFVFPWALVYDIPLETGDPKTARECRILQDQEWRRFQADSDHTRTTCPYDSEHRSGVICPFGFWGFRYQIEQPPSMPAGRALPLRIPSDRPPLDLVLATSDDLIPKLRGEHVATLREQLTQFTLRECRSRADIKTALAAPDIELVYFYCHGSRRPLPNNNATTPSLGVGSGELIDPEDLVTWSVDWPLGHWRDTSPLVFINGCHTADLTPEELVSFVDVFAGLNAGGVVGTEIILHQQVANEAAEAFLHYFEQGKTVGEAMHHMRMRFLRKGNILGLAYTPYCSVSLRLTGSTA